MGHNTISSMERIVDANDNFRFVEGAGVLNLPSGMTVTYNKWSLSGTHLMIVIAGTINPDLPTGQINAVATYTFPDYIKDKIKPLGSNRIAFANITAVDNDYHTYNRSGFITKSVPAGDIIMYLSSGSTPQYTYLFRIQFDLLIDAS